MQNHKPPTPLVSRQRYRDIAYSMDTLIPGFYFWLGSLAIRIWGSEAEETYLGTLHSFAGVALVLSGYRIYSTYQGDYDPRQTQAGRD